MMIYKWYCKVAEPEANEDGVLDYQGLVAAENLHAAMDKVLEYTCLNDEGAVFELTFEPWDTDILAMDAKLLYAIEEDHIW